MVDADGRADVADCVDDHLDYDRDVFGGLVEPDNAGNGQQEGQVAEHGAEDAQAVESVELTSFEERPSAARRCWSKLTLRLATSGSSLSRTCCQHRIGICGGEQSVARRGELLTAHPARVLQLHGEAGGLAEAADRAGNQREHLRVAKAAECAGCAVDDRLRAVVRTLALIERRKVDDRPGRYSARKARRHRR